MKNILVEWVDSRSEDGWTEQECLDVRVAHITTLGCLVRETDDVLCVAATTDEVTGQVAGIMFIPKVCVVKMFEVTAAITPAKKTKD